MIKPKNNKLGFSMEHGGRSGTNPKSFTWGSYGVVMDTALVHFDDGGGCTNLHLK